jgi:hypothetical protein
MDIQSPPTTRLLSPKTTTNTSSEYSTDFTNNITGNGETGGRAIQKTKSPAVVPSKMGYFTHDNLGGVCRGEQPKPKAVES